MKFLYSLVMLLGRICMSAIFLISGVSKLFSYNETIQLMASKGMTMLPLFYGAAVIIEILAGLCILIGYKVRWAAALLALYLIPVTLTFHHFWDLEGVARVLQMHMFLKNLAIIGGLLFLIGCGPGKLACDWWCRKHEPSIQ